jgi:hypothetical protein
VFFYNWHFVAVLVILFTVCIAPIHPIMDYCANNPFSVEWDKTKATMETIKWTLGANGVTKHEIVSPILSKFELGNIMAHCLTVMHKIDARIGNNAANHFTLYMNVFPRTLSLPHVATWDTVLVDHPLGAQDVASFQQAIRHFIAVHASDKDCHELLDYIHNIAKLRKMDIQTYYSCLNELNHQVDWLPGNDLPLAEDQLQQAFFDGMPTSWKEQYKNASRSVRNTACVVCNKRISCSGPSLMVCLPAGRNSTRTPVVLFVILPLWPA